MLVSIQAGNSDDKLTQRKWSRFVGALSEIIAHHEIARHFHGGPPTSAPWQNVCFVVAIHADGLERLKQDLTKCRKDYNQDSVCVLTGQPEFV